MEVYEQPERHIKEFHVAQELGLVNRQNLLNRFGFHKNATFNQDVEPQRFLTGEPFVVDHNGLLTDASQTPQSKLLKQTPLIDGFDQPWPFTILNLLFVSAC